MYLALSFEFDSYLTKFLTIRNLSESTISHKFLNIEVFRLFNAHV